MRLVNIETLKLEEFLADPPPYAILSHAWEDGEVSLQDLDRADVLPSKPGWTKIVNFCRHVHRHADLVDGSTGPVRHVWIDTCCIDKTSTADLSESINSMFRWYRNAAVCFAYLSDVHCPEGHPSDAFEKSRWFTRGWTLQELLAPKRLEFFDRSWSHLGSRASLVDRVSDRTRVPLQVLVHGEWSGLSIAQRMSWAAGRQTTRPEDIAYCLLGIFDVNMPPLYGEGGERAFIRLQEEILKEFDDQSILAWDASGIDETWGTIGALAPAPAYFAESAHVEAIPSRGNPMSITSRGIHAELVIVLDEHLPGQTPLNNGTSYLRGQKVAVLSCTDGGDLTSRIGIPVVPSIVNEAHYSRLRSKPVHFPKFNAFVEGKPVLLAKRNQKEDFQPKATRGWLEYRLRRGGNQAEPRFQFIGAHPHGMWRDNKETSTLLLKLPSKPPEMIHTALLFRLKTSPTEDVHCAVYLELHPGARRSRIGVSCDIPTPSPSEKADMEQLVAKLARQAPVMVKGGEHKLTHSDTVVTAKITASLVQTLWAFEASVIPSAALNIPRR
ncbi:hypothetical protein ACRALDRAFT_1080192 [Sodiomyces alcalophilus JCM 7366]|uniref:uncharacterized protein n=1 Tax=Sodiomyces alcalophilus JCM 7366 TaxID=591952 RepID=UPI0039B4835D